MRFLVSHELLEEVGGLVAGWQDAIDHLRAFPGTMYCPNLMANTLWKADSLRLAAESGCTASVARTVFEAEPLATRAISWFEQQRDFARAVHKVKDAATAIQKISRGADAGRAKSERLSGEAAARAVLLGDVDGVRRQPGAAAEQVVQQLLDAVQPHIKRLQRLGYVPPVEVQSDPAFLSIVMPHLPVEVRQDQPSMARVAVAWRDNRFASVTQSIVASAAVLRWVHYRDVPADATKDPFATGDRLDAEHAAYAPLVHVFTCDKRTAPEVERALKEAGSGTQVVRATKIDKIVAACERALDGAHSSEREAKGGEGA
ncbi:MAG TPA: hypothetical protein DEF51_24205 [Myxococcales bacterium]|nr:hypothetical protein [Myxococcales bacterium]